MIKKIKNYEIISKIASGGMANIYLGLDTVTDAKVAIKILKDEVSDKEKIYERFSQEGLLNLDHKNIVKILDAGVHENTPYIVMEFIEGADLEELIKKKGALSLNEFFSIVNQILSALSYVHYKGIIHRDIKSKNILIDKAGNIKLTDFGIAKSLYSSIKTSTGGYLGAPAYSSPEQMDGKEVDSRSDIYSLGITFYEMLAGVTPFSSSSIPSLIKEKFTGTYRQISAFRTDVPSYITAIISRCIAVDPKDRFASIEEIVNALNRAENNETVIIIGPNAKAKTANTAKPVKSYKKLAFIASSIGISMLIVIIILAVKLSGKTDKTVAAAFVESTAGVAMETIVPETTAAVTTVSKTTAAETYKTSTTTATTVDYEKIRKQDLAEESFLDKMFSLLNEYSSVSNHINTYGGKNINFGQSNTIEFEGSVLVKYQELANQLRNFSCPSSYENNKNNLIGIAESICFYQNEVVEINKNGSYEAYVNSFNACNQKISDLFDYFNSMVDNHNKKYH